MAPRYYWNAAKKEQQLQDGLGYGFAIPTQDLLNAFEDGDARATMIVASPHGNATINKTITRLNLDTAAWISPTNFGSGEGWYAIGKVDWSTGYYNMKKSQLSTILCNSGNNTQCSGKNNIILRWADVLLIAAEAGVQSGHDDVALQLVNKLRERARKSARTIDYKKSGTTSACYTYAEAATPADLTSIDLAKVQNERRVEMYGEAERFWDLVRWKETDKFRKEDIAGNKFQYNEATLGRWPIPQGEIILHTGGNLKQNPGY